MENSVKETLLQIAENFNNLSAMAEEITKVGEICIKAINSGHKIMFCGNGGSAADSQHLAAELVGRFEKNRKAMNAIALTVDSSVLTSISNDYGYDMVFERQVEGLGKEGDVLIGISTSGNSANVLKAFEQAKAQKITTIAFTGNSGGKCKSFVDFCLCVPADTAARIQEMHIAAGHILCGLIENACAKYED